MNNYPHPLIAREGWLFLCVALLVAIAATFWLGFGSVPIWVIVIFILQFFRDPRD
jgi:phosphatidylserine decarboxylase